jgi:protein-disulfide isomerase
MEPMHSARRGLLFLILAALLAAQDWQTATTLPGVDFTGLTAAQKAIAIKVMRAHDCSCGCAMKLAECRFKDEGCSYSKGLGLVVVEALKKGGNEASAMAAIDASPLSHRTPTKVLEDPVQISIQGAPITGPANAPVTIIEYSDFQCPYCAKAVEELRTVLQAYPTQVKLVFKQFPLDQHSQAALAAAASLAAHKQGKFWPLHDAMYADRTHLSKQNIEAMASKIGLDMKKFSQDWQAPSTKQEVLREMEEGERSGVQGTPTIFIDGKKYNGSLALDAMRQIIDDELKPKK